MGRTFTGFLPNRAKPALIKSTAIVSPAEGDFLQTDQKDGQTQYKPRIKEGRTESGELEVVCYKSVSGKYDGCHAAKKLPGGARRKAVINRSRAVAMLKVSISFPSSVFRIFSVIGRASRNRVEYTPIITGYAAGDNAIFVRRRRFRQPAPGITGFYLT